MNIPFIHQKMPHNRIFTNFPVKYKRFPQTGVGITVALPVKQK